MLRSLVGSEMCIRDSVGRAASGKKDKKLARATGRGRDVEQQSALSASPAATSAQHQQLQNMQAELARMTMDRDRSLAELDRMSRELAQLKNRQHVPDGMQPRSPPRTDVRYYHRSDGSNNYPNQDSNSSGYYGQGAARYGRQSPQQPRQPRRCWNCNETSHLSLIHI